MPAQDKLVVRKIIPARREEVFAAWTDPESIRQWMCPGDVESAEATLDVRVGGSYQIRMKRKGMDDHLIDGVYQVVEPPSRLVFTFIGKGHDSNPTLVTVELFERGEQCELVLTHERITGAENLSGKTRGWTGIADKLAQYFAARKGRA
jgi:uncharacterized protein YndB with AHSA1/START domain